jgi:hypothetical protein
MSKNYGFLKTLDFKKARKYRFCQLSRFRYYIQETGLHLVKFLNLVEMRQETLQSQQEPKPLSKNAKKKQNHKIRSDFWVDVSEKRKRIILETEPLLLKFENLHFREISTQEEIFKLVEEIEDSIIIWSYVRDLLKYVIHEKSVKGISSDHCATCRFGMDYYDSDNEDNQKDDDEENEDEDSDEDDDDTDHEFVTFRYVEECGEPPCPPGDINHADPDYQEWRAQTRLRRKQMEEMNKKLFPRVAGAIYEDNF